MINSKTLITRLVRLHAVWERDSESNDIAARIGRDWIKGVVYGISLSIKETHALTAAKKAERK
jgi:hypothetical protein